MCGICGQFRFDNQPVSRGHIETMMDKIKRRGPDASGQYLQDNIGLGHQRLSIIEIGRAHV